MGRRRYIIQGFPERMEELYINTGLTQVEFARRAGFNRKAIREYMDGTGSPSMLTIMRICAAYNVSADYLLFGKE